MIVNLITYRNIQFRQPLEREGFEVAEFSPLTEPAQLREEIKKSSSSYTLIELGDEGSTDRKRTGEILKLLYAHTKLICLCEKITPFISGLLLENGIADCIEHFRTERITSYIRCLETKPSQRYGTFLILDDRESHKNMLSGIIRRFGYSTEFVTDGDSLFSAMKENQTIMILMNLGTAGLDLNGIVRRAYGSSEIKKFPVIAYKSLQQGLFVHEVLNGLNRLTKVIYSPEELFCMLVDLLFKKEIMSTASEFSSSLHFDKFRNYAAATIPNIYYNLNGEPFSNECIFATDHIESMIKSADEITTSLIKIDGIKWLRLTQSQGKRPTCGAGA